MSDPFAPSGPFSGIAPNLIPNPPGEMPEAQSAGSAAGPSPFLEPQDVNSVIDNLTLDRPLKLFIPPAILQMYPNHEFRVINSIPQEIVDAGNRGMRPVTNPEAVRLFDGLVAGTDKTGKPFRPILCAREKPVGIAVRKRQRAQLQSLYAGMDPKNKELGGRYTSGVDAKDGTFLQREGSPWRIKVGDK